MRADDEVFLIGAVRIAQRAAEPVHPSWRDLPEGPLYIAESTQSSTGVMLFLHETEIEPVE